MAASHPIRQAGRNIVGGRNSGIERQARPDHLLERPLVSVGATWAGEQVCVGADCLPAYSDGDDRKPLRNVRPPARGYFGNRLSVSALPLIAERSSLPKISA